MNLLIVGRGQGSWTMRGIQLGAALGARVVSVPSDDDLRWAELVVLVKRAGQCATFVRGRCGKPIVWDALDFWHQPGENHINEARARVRLQEELAIIAPALAIGATQAMADACSGTYLPHHSWAGLVPTPARDVVQTVGYEGNPAYLGRWAAALQHECGRRGWRFLYGPGAMRLADIAVAFRDGAWDGWMCRQWKSGVKLVNAIAAGRPILTQHSAAWRELQPAGMIVETVAQLPAALDSWSGFAARQAVADEAMARAPAYTLDSIAARYTQLLEQVGSIQGAA